MIKILNIITCTLVIVGTIIGAGFASGREIYTFFYIYGINGLIGMILSIFLIGYIIYKILKIIKQYDINNYKELLDIILKRERKYINYERVLNFIINIFLLTTFFIMCAGFSAYFYQEFGINRIYSSIAIAILSYIILNKNINGLFTINSILMPIVIIILMMLGIKSLKTDNTISLHINNLSWIIKTILYASYNTITLASVLIPMKKYIKQNTDHIKIVVSSIIIIILLGIIMFLLLLNINTDISKIELPAVYAVSNFGKIYQYIYGIIILGAIITTAISSAFGFLNNVSENHEQYILLNKLICFISVIVAMFGFSNLVNSLYPLFGILGIIQLILIIKCK